MVLEIPDTVICEIKKELLAQLRQELEEERERYDILTVKDLAQMLSVSYQTANNITNKYDDFPVIRIANKKRMVREDVINWLREHAFISPSNFNGL